MTLLEKQIIESIAYSFDDENNQEEFVFSKRKISDAIDILSNAGPTFGKIIKNESHGDNTYYADKNKFKGPMMIISQRYKHWMFDNKKYIIDNIYYILLADGREFLEFCIEFDIEDAIEICNVIYCFADRTWEHSGSDLFQNIKSCKPLWDTIRNIIRLFRNKNISNI